MPGKFSRSPTTPNKPPVCHKSPLVPLALGLLPWDRPANLFLKWQGSPAAGNQQRSWAMQTTPAPAFQQQNAAGTAAPIAFTLIVFIYADGARFDYVCRVWNPTRDLIFRTGANLPIQRRTGWTTGLVAVGTTSFTDLCTFELMA